MKTLNSIEILENSIVQVRYESGGKYERIALYPGQDTSAQFASVQALCASVWTPEVVLAYAESTKRDLLGD